MKCKKHPEDHSSSGGVCATCLRQRLIALIAAQSEAAEGNHFKEDERESDANPPPPQPLVFPRSVSPYISRRKSDTAPVTQEFRRRDHVESYNCLPDRKFFSTPQIGPAGRVIVDDDNYRDKRKAHRKFWLFSSLFRSKSAVTNTDLDPRASESGEAPSRSWFSSVIPRRKQLRTCSLDETTVQSNRRKHRGQGRGMSPANNCSDDESDVDNCNVETSGSNTEELKQTPRRTPGRNGGTRRSHLSRNVSDIVFCLSPLVRPSPNRIWNQKGGGLPPEIGVAGESRVPMKSSNLSGGSFCKNRSRKLADFGRCKRNH